MTEGERVRDIEGEKARRRAAREMIGRYHDEQLRLLLEHVREGLAQLDAGELDAFGLDEVIHHYKRSAQKLWSFCGSSGSAWERAALTVEWRREEGEEETDWWGGRSAAPRERVRPRPRLLTFVHCSSCQPSHHPDPRVIGEALSVT